MGVNKHIKRVLKRGDIFYADLSYITGKNSIQTGMRPVLIISNEACNTYSPIITIVPITSKNKKINLPTHCKVGKVSRFIREDSIVLCEQMMPIPVSHIKEKVGSIGEETMNIIDKKISIQLGLQIQCNSI